MKTGEGTPDLSFLCEHLESHEAWLMDRALSYAERQGYTRYTTTAVEAWRSSIQGLTASVRRAAETFDAPPEFEPDMRYTDNPVSAFGVEEARRHRTRGVTLAMFLGLFKYYRRAYQDCMDELLADEPALHFYQRYLRQVFDLVEISYCQEWTGVDEGDLLAELQAANREATTEKTKYRTLFDGSSDAIMTLSPEEGFLSCNPATLKLFGCASEKDFISLFPGELSPARQPRGENSGELADKLMKEAMEQGARDFEWRHHRPDGTTFDASVRLTAMNLQGRKVLLATVRDISPRKALQAQLEQSHAQLERSNEDLEQFAYVASHDLREPLRMVTSFLELLQRKYGGQLDEKADLYIGHAVDGAERMEGLLGDLLDLSRVGTHGRPLAATEMTSALNRALKNLGPVIREVGAEVSRSELCQVIGDETQLVQLLQNLVANGIKFHAPDATPRVEVSCQRRGDVAEFCVRDQGIGVDPKHAERIFEVFSRLHSQREYAGSGIGLSICKKILQRHGGRIWLEPAPGGGTAFKFELPTP